MKRIIGLDLGTTSIGWAVVDEAENANEQSSIIDLGVRIVPLSVDENLNFSKGKSITTNADRSLKHGMRRNKDRYKLRRDSLIGYLKNIGAISDDTLLCENGLSTTHQTIKLRAESAQKVISLSDFARVLISINKKRGYKSNRKANKSDNENGEIIDGLDVAEQLKKNGITPGQYVVSLMRSGKPIKNISFYTSDLIDELKYIWQNAQRRYPNLFSQEQYEKIIGCNTKDIIDLFKRLGIEFPENKGLNLKQRREYDYNLRNDAAEDKELKPEEYLNAIVAVSREIRQSDSYLGRISNHSKVLKMEDMTVGQYLYNSILENPHFSTRNIVFNRQDYIDEFDRIWEIQSQAYPNILTSEAKDKIRNEIIFYQRPLKSKKGLVSYCEFEQRQIQIKDEQGKLRICTTGLRVAPKSSPLATDFRIWQRLNDAQVENTETKEKSELSEEEKQLLYTELLVREKYKGSEVLKLLYGKQARSYKLNFEELIGNTTYSRIYNAIRVAIIEHFLPIGYDNLKYNTAIYDYNANSKKDNALDKSPRAKDAISELKAIMNHLGWNSSVLNWDCAQIATEQQESAYIRLWHLLYSYTGDNSATGIDRLVYKVKGIVNCDMDSAKKIATIVFEDDYVKLSAKAIRKILPHMIAGLNYTEARKASGYNHSKSSITAEENQERKLLSSLDILRKNSLRNPVVEKILNQMINVVNELILRYGKDVSNGNDKIDEIRVELARELKKSAEERGQMTKSINDATKENERIKGLLQDEPFNLSRVGKNDIIKYRLYKELEPIGYKTLYTRKYISPTELFTNNVEIEHIIPRAKLFDDSFANKTLAYHSENIEKGNMTAMDYISEKHSLEKERYLSDIDLLEREGSLSKSKAKKLRMSESEIPENFIERDLKTTQYISKKAIEILKQVARNVVATSGEITARLREDWQLVDGMKELNWDKYQNLGLTRIEQNHRGDKIKIIDSWTKRNDHRHHAMDALTVAFTKQSFIQYLNNLNAQGEIGSSIAGIRYRELYRDKNDNKLKFKSPIGNATTFRRMALTKLNDVLISIKAKNKVVTPKLNKPRNGASKRELTPRGALHKETIYRKSYCYKTSEVAVGGKMTTKIVALVANQQIRRALEHRLAINGFDAKKAFTGRNSLDKNPIWLDDAQTIYVPTKVKIVEKEERFTVRKPVSPDIKVNDVVDVQIRRVLENRLDEYNGDTKKAFTDIDKNPIYQNKDKGIKIKTVTVKGVNNAIALHEKRDHKGELIVSHEGKFIPTDYVQTGNNHHIAIFEDENGNLQEHVVSFFEAAETARQQLSIVDKNYKSEDGWKFLFSMKQNEYFVFPNETTGFDPTMIDLKDEQNYKYISPNLFRVQKITSKDYMFRHHLDTTIQVEGNLSGITYKRITTINKLKGVVKVRVNHIGKIEEVGEY